MESEDTGLGGIPLKNKKDHENFAIICSSKMETSTSICKGAFLKEISSRILENLTFDTLEEIITMLSTQRDKKIPAKKAPAKKSLKQMKQAAKAHADIFGGDEDGDRDGDYSNLEDQFF